MKKYYLFTLSTCSPCRQVKAMLANTDLDVEVKVIDAREDNLNSMRFGIQRVPALIIEEDGKKIMHEISTEKIKKWIWAHERTVDPQVIIVTEHRNKQSVKNIPEDKEAQIVMNMIGAKMGHEITEIYADQIKHHDTGGHIEHVLELVVMTRNQFNLYVK